MCSPTLSLETIQKKRKSSNTRFVDKFHLGWKTLLRDPVVEENKKSLLT